MGEISFDHIKSVLDARRVFAEHQEDKESGGYVVDRYFFHRNPERNVLSVLENLPTLNGHDCAAAIERVVENNDHASVLDLGCGRGTAARDLEDKHAEGISVIGLTARVYEPLQIPREQVVVGDIADLKKHFKPNSFDVVYSAATLVHVPRHFIDVARQVYSVLKPDGEAFLSVKYGSDEHNKIKGFESMRQWLDQNGYEFNFDAYPVEEEIYAVEDVAFRKTDEYLRLPLKYSGEDGYEFDPNMAQRIMELKADKG